MNKQKGIFVEFFPQNSFCTNNLNTGAGIGITLQVNVIGMKMKK